ncbi:FAD-dependent monooxygenase [Pseudonocardia adelaidensis]|uniref:FAD-dependent monooxygenase n=1 Tax=Pseudonocardia adelaidensis TaxID=648754 RepID=A0ABP9NN41_9PSEU
MVGAGPTGLFLACELALAGVDVAVVEREAVPSGQSRGGGVNQRSAEVLAMRGLLDAVTERAVPRESVGGHFAFLPVPLDARPWRTRYPDGIMIPQDRLEQILETRLRELGVRVRRSTELVGLVQDSDGVEATVSDGRVRGRYLVACDGGHSAVRKLVGADFPGQAGTMAAVSADIELASAGETVPRTVGHISTMMRPGGGYWMMLHPLDGEGGRVAGYRAVFGGPPQAALPRTAPVTADEVAAALTAVHGPDTVLARLRWGTRFSDAHRQLAQYRHGRVLFAGDAAHIHLPIGGQGLNLGLQDAMNLGWKLAGVVAGRSPEALLDTYHDERHPVAARVLATVRAQRVIAFPSPEADDVRGLREIVMDMARLPDGNEYLAGLMSGLAIRYDLGDPDPLVGARMIDLALGTQDGVTTVSALLRAGRGLLLDLDAPLAPVHEVAWGVDRIPARVVGSPVGTDVGAARVLVRPDGYVGWVGREPHERPDAALARCFAGSAQEAPALLG